MLSRSKLSSEIKSALRRSRCVALLGPRQCGKTTLAHFVADKMGAVFFDLEDPEVLSRFANPKIALERFEGLIVLDEIQLKPELFPVLRVLLDRNPLPARFMILGSASPDLILQSSESLAGRVEFIDLRGFSLEEVGSDNLLRLWSRGGFPLSYLAENDNDSFIWRKNFMRTFLERDIRNLGIDIPPEVLRRFLLMLTHFHGQLWNASRLAGSLDLTAPTVKRYLDIMTGAYLVRQVRPWFENIGKRLVKSPKIYIRDSGILHFFANIKNMDELEAHPYYSSSWEGFAMEEIIQIIGERDIYFWRTQAGAELDMILPFGTHKVGFEFKCTEKPKITKSIRIAMHDLSLKHLYIVYPGKSSFRIEDKITALSLLDIPIHFTEEVKSE